MTWFPVTFALLQHRNIGTFVFYHPGLSINFEQEKKLAEPDAIHLELKSAVRDSWRADKHHVLAIDLASESDPDAVFAQSGESRKGKCDSGWCWISADAACPAVPCSIHQESQESHKCKKIKMCIVQYTLN